MARQWYKKTLKSWGLPFAFERPLYVLVTALQLHLLFSAWQALPQMIYATTGLLNTAITCISFAGWAFLFLATFSIDHFELFGIKQSMGVVKETTTPLMKVKVRQY